MPNLTDLATVKAWLPGIAQSNTNADPILSALIASTSADFLRACNRLDLLTATYNEVRTGDGSCRLALRHWPIQSLAGLAVGGLSVAKSPDGFQPGWYLNSDDDPELNFVLFLTGAVFGDGLSVTVQYTAGYMPAPAEVQQAVTEWVALRYTRRPSAGQTQARTTEGEHTDFSADDIPPNTQRVIDRYTRAKPAYAMPAAPVDAAAAAPRSRRPAPRNG